MSAFEFLTVETADTVATVTMRRPPVNAFSLPMYQEMTALFSAIERHAPNARAVVLLGEGRHFCGGNDLNEFRSMTPENAGARMKIVREAFWSIYDSALPVIAAVRGVAVGTGLAIAASCDMIVASRDASFGLPEIAVGAMGGAKHLSRLVPQGLVRQMHYTADPVSASTLGQFGGIATVVDDGEVISAAVELAHRVTRHSPVAIKIAKRSLNSIEFMDLKSGYEFEQGLTGELSGYDDAKEAVEAFFERREPQYTGA
ncbi:enoyl-CoA hydratase-related protein [Rhodococcus koreensis]|uniref:enoyl-CoA hydratase-related protein n=1 Tax=Rhodococcus koreensis TaxID=99653 RepID=UPI00366D62B4